MKYQSEIIKEIIDTRGHKKSSLHYESECIESWIDENKGSYPKLCDYQSEWLNYISILDDTGGGEQPDPEPPIGKFPYETLVDVTEATLNNVVPYAYKSAILKGNTLINLVNFTDNAYKSSGTITSKEGNKISFKTSTTGKFNLGCKLPMLKPNTKYLLKIKAESSLSADVSFNILNTTSNAYLIPNTTISDTTYFFTTKDVVDNIQLSFIRSKSIGDDTVVGEAVICEYQEGIENWNIPYFEGMLSVKTPVLTTSNEDGTKSYILTVNEEVELRGIGDVKDELDLLTGELTQRIGEDGVVLSQEVIKTVDLTVVNQDGENVSLKPIEGTMHLTTSSETINPLFSGEIPVEAITQNLTSFIEE